MTKSSSGDVRFTCTACHTSSSNHRNLEMHIEAAHTKVALKCTICPDYSTKHSAAFKRHLQSVHRVFSNWDAYVSRDGDERSTGSEEAEEGEEELRSRYRCMECGNYYKDEQQLNLHYEVDHLANASLHFCNICDRAFQWKRDLERHQHVHPENINPLQAFRSERASTPVPEIVFSDLPPMTPDVQVLTPPLGPALPATCSADHVPPSLSKLLADLETLTPLRPLPPKTPESDAFRTPLSSFSPAEAGHSSRPAPRASFAASFADASLLVDTTSRMLADILGSPDSGVDDDQESGDFLAVAH
jgi:transcription elongation factor Elf1